MARMTIGNITITGFVNHVDGSRFVLGTGSYTDKSGGTKIFKESVTVFTDAKFDGVMPEKGEYIEVTNVDIIVSERRDKPDTLQAAVNVRFANQVNKLDAPVKKEGTASTAPSDAPADAPGADNDI